MPPAAPLSDTAVDAALARGKWVLAATIIGSSMAFIDGTVVNVALPALQNALHATVSDVQWIVESYALLLAALLLVGGSLGDIYGRRRVYIFGVTLFAAGSAACGFSPTVELLIIARAVQGVGAALLVPGSLALISASFPVETRGHAIGIWSGATAATAAIGPVIGGWLVENASWRWAFLLNLPLAAAVIALSLWRVPESRNEDAPPSLDYAGAALGTLALGGITYALIELPNNHRRAFAAAILGTACLIAFAVVEYRSAQPMVSFQLFRNRSFAAANLLTLFLYTALSGMLFFYPLDLIQIQHYTATQAGAALLPLITLMFLLSRWSGGLVARYGARLPLTVGPLISAIGFALAIIPGIGGSYWRTFFPSILLLGLGMSIAVAPLTTVIMTSLPENIAGIASGINNAVSRLAGLLSVAVLGLILVTSFNHSLDRRLAPLHLNPAARASIDAQRSHLAAAQSSDARIRQAIAQSFVHGYRYVLAATVLLALARALSAQLITSTADPQADPQAGPQTESP
jgi:EmrB/QacA subfamily drug resistance transporter